MKESYVKFCKENIFANVRIMLAILSTAILIAWLLFRIFIQGGPAITIDIIVVFSTMAIFAINMIIEIMVLTLDIRNIELTLAKLERRKKK